MKAGTPRWPVSVFCNVLDLACISAYMSYRKKTRDAISKINFIFQLATKLREALVQGKTAALDAVLLSLFNNFYQNLIVDGSRKRKQCQVNVNCQQNKMQNSVAYAVDQFGKVYRLCKS